ncbi:hypothetical protein G3E01_003244 [Salmonella enterica subsp. enterica]|nr:hypothetical protein [Salmonella enterica subsp. enterica]
MNNKFTIDDLNDLPPDVKRIFKQNLPNIRFTKDAEQNILSVLKSTHKNQMAQILLANIIMRCFGLNSANESTIISSDLINEIITEENIKLNTPIND